MPRKNQKAQNEYMREYRKLNPGKREANTNKSIQKSFKSFLKYKIKSITAVDVRKNLIPDLDIDYMMDLFEKQQGRCAISGHLMTHIKGDVYSLSIDRINSMHGHVKGNVQLVCLAMQYAKNKFDGDVIKEFMRTMPGIQCV